MLEYINWSVVSYLSITTVSATRLHPRMGLVSTAETMETIL